MTDESLDPATGYLHTAGHLHTARCYWDLRECRWVCRPARPARDADVPAGSAAGGERQG